MSRIKVGYIGDSPYIFSGFGVVAKAIMSRLSPEDFEIHILGTMYQHYPSNTDSIPALKSYQPVCIHDLMGMKSSIDFLHHIRPDVLFMIADPGTLRNRYGTIMLSGMAQGILSVTYFPIEGAPLNPHIIEQARLSDAPVTYTKWGADLLNSLDAEGLNRVGYVWHGADHAPFIQYDRGVRDRLRKLVGWHDRFVIGLIGMNKRTNRQPVMIEVANLLKTSGRDDALVYLHCQQAGEMIMGGWELDWIIGAYDVMDQIQLKPRQEEHKYIGRPRTSSLEEMLDLPLPKDKEEAEANLGKLDFISLLNLFDVYVDPASAHGWNLPACEAARCGVPLIMVDDGFARSEIYGDCALMMKPSAADYWHTGAVLPLVSPKAIQRAVIELWDDKAKRQHFGTAAKEKFDTISWQAAADVFADKLKTTYDVARELLVE